jgi:hypothetical protein
MHRQMWCKVRLGNCDKSKILSHRLQAQEMRHLSQNAQKIILDVFSFIASNFSKDADVIVIRIFVARSSLRI